MLNLLCHRGIPPNSNFNTQLLTTCLNHSFFNFFFFFFFFRATPAAYGGSRARGLIGPAAAGLPLSHSKMGSELCLRPTPQLTEHQILNPLSEARD